MPIIPKCKKCGREGGFGTNTAEQICARCEKPRGKKEASNPEEKPEEKKK